MRRPGVRIPSRPPSFKTTSSVPNSSYRGTLGLSSLPDSLRYLVIHPEQHCLSAASSVKTSRLERSRFAADATREVVGLGRLQRSRPTSGPPERRAPTYAAALLRYASARSRRGSAHHPEAVRP